MDIKHELESLQIGQSFNTQAKRTGVYVVAKRLNIAIKTDKISDTETKVTRVNGKVEKPVERSTLERVKSLSIADRLELFENFELCCGYNRGSCICEPEPIAAPVVVSQPVARPNIAALQAVINGIESGGLNLAAEPVDEWTGWSEERKAPDEAAGETVTYRQHIKTGKRREIRRETAWD